PCSVSYTLRSAPSPLALHDALPISFVVGWFASLLPSWFHARANALEDPRERGPLRILTVYLGLASLPLSLAAISLHVTSASGAELGSVVLHAQGAEERRVGREGRERRRVYR